MKLKTFILSAIAVIGMATPAFAKNTKDNVSSTEDQKTEVTEHDMNVYGANYTDGDKFEGLTRKVGFDLHDVPRQTGHTEACHFCIHGLFPTFLLFYQYTAQRALAQARNGKNQAKLTKIRLTGLQNVGIFRVSQDSISYGK